MKDPLLDPLFRNTLLKPINAWTRQRREEDRSRRDARWGTRKNALKGALARILLSLLFLAISTFILQTDLLTASGRIGALSIFSLTMLNYFHRQLLHRMEKSPELHAFSLWPVDPRIVAQRQLQLGAGHWLFGPGFGTLLIGFTAAALYWRPSYESVILGTLATLCVRWSLEILSLLALRWRVIMTIARLATTAVWIVCITGRISWVEKHTMDFLNASGSWLSALIPMGWIYRIVFPIPITDESIRSSLAWLTILTLWLPLASLWLRRHTVQKYTAWWQQIQSDPFAENETEQRETELESDQESGTDTRESHPASWERTVTLDRNDPKWIEVQHRLRALFSTPEIPSESLSRADPDRWMLSWLTRQEREVWNLISASAPRLLHALRQAALCLGAGWLILLLTPLWPAASVAAQFAPQCGALAFLICWTAKRGFQNSGWNQAQYAPVSLFPVRWKEVHGIHMKWALVLSLLMFPLFWVYQFGVALALKQDWIWTTVMAIKWTATLVPLNGVRALLLNGSVGQRVTLFTRRSIVPLTLYLIYLVSQVVLLMTALLMTWGLQDQRGLVGSILVVAITALLQFISRHYHNRRWYDMGRPGG